MVDDEDRARYIGSLMLELAAACRQYDAADREIHDSGRPGSRASADLPGAIHRRREHHDLILGYIQSGREQGIDLSRIARTIARTFVD